MAISPSEPLNASVHESYRQAGGARDGQRDTGATRARAAQHDLALEIRRVDGDVAARGEAERRVGRRAGRRLPASGR